MKLTKYLLFILIFINFYLNLIVYENLFQRLNFIKLIK